MSEWIEVKEQSPEIRSSVLTWNGCYVCQCSYNANRMAKTEKGRAPRFENAFGIHHGVTHWMPLPNPPEPMK